LQQLVWRVTDSASLFSLSNYHFFVNSYTVFVYVYLQKREIRKREIANKFVIFMVWIKKEIKKERNIIVSNRQKDISPYIGGICVSRSEINNFTTIPLFN
jgi:hypothetical protein